MGTQVTVTSFIINPDSGSNVNTVTAYYKECTIEKQVITKPTTGTYNVTSTIIGQPSTVANTYKIVVNGIKYPDPTSTTVISGTINLTFYVTINQVAQSVSVITTDPYKSTSTATLKVAGAKCYPSCEYVSGSYGNVSVTISTGQTVKLNQFVSNALGAGYGNSITCTVTQ